MEKKPSPGLPPRLIATFAVVLLVLLAAGGWFYVSEKNRLKGEAESGLRAVALLKVDQIVQWRTERLADAMVASSSPFASRAFAAFLGNAKSQDARDLLLDLRLVMESNRYEDVMLVDSGGSVRTSVAGTSGVLGAEDMRALSDSWLQGQPVLAELSADPGNTPVHLDVVAPIFTSIGGKRVPAGAILLRMNAEEFLFPLIQSWPTVSASAETLLVRRDGDSVLFLNELRHRKDTALKLRISLDRADVPAVMAMKGTTGLVYGRDYRGVPVAAVVLAIPGSSWFIITKEDDAEILAPWRLAAALILALLLGLVAGAVGLFLMFWQQSEKSHYAALLQAETALRATEERHRVTLMSVGDGIIVTDARGTVTMINPSAAALTGWTQDEASQKPLEQVFPIIEENSRHEVENPVRRVVREGRVIGLANHTVLVHRDGTERAIADSGAPIRNEKGDIEGVVLVFRDVSGERRALNALRDSEELYRSLFTNMLNGFAYCRMLYENGQPADFVYLEVNAVFSKMTGLADVKGRKVSDVIPGIRESDPELIRIYGRVAQGGSPERFETYVRALDDWYSISVYCPRPDHFVAVFDVITDRKKSEAQRVLLSAAVDQTAEMVIVTDRNGTIQYVNPAFESVTGYARTEAIGHTPRILKSGIQDDAFYARLWETITAGITWKGQFQNRKKDGTIYPEDAIISPVFDEQGEIVNFVGAKHDSSLERSLEAQLRQAQKMDSVGRLAGGVAHDFNNMLQVITSYLEIALRDSTLSASQRQNLSQIGSAARRAADLTSQLLAFARKQIVSPRIIDLNDAVERTMKMLQRLIGEDIEIVWKPGVLAGKVKIDPTQLDQVLANLAVNARDAIGGVGSLVLETSDVTLDKAYSETHVGFVPGRYLLLTVTDTGSGMSAEVQSHLFEPFYTTKSVGKGTGLGLATVYGIVKQNEGFISVYSEPGNGTSFRIYLRSVSADIDQKAAKETSEESFPGGGETILIVEDEEAILQVSRMLLEQMGYHVLTAGTPGEAIHHAESHQGTIHLLITDVIMPRMNGPELSRALFARRADMKCLFISGYTADAIGRRGILDDGAHFLSKPFTNRQLAEKVREVLDSPDR
jgi:PAS domain S-box-containing protein